MRFHEFNYFDPSKKVVNAIDGVVEAYDGSNLYNIRPAYSQILFNNEDGENCTWNTAHTALTIEHGMNCYPIVMVFNASGMQVYPDVKVNSSSSFTLVFDAVNPVDAGEQWLCTFTFGAGYGGDSAVLESDIGNAWQSVREAIENNVLSTVIESSTDSSVSISADKVMRYTPSGDGTVDIVANDALHYGSCIMFITLGASNAITFTHNSNAITPLDALVSNKTNQVIIEIIGNGTTNDINITVVRTW